MEANAKIDEIFKSKVINHYKINMKNKGEANKKTQKLGTIRQMWEQGRSYDQVEENLMTMLASDTPNMEMVSDEEDME